MNRLVVRGLIFSGLIACWLLTVCEGLAAADVRADERSVVESDEVIDDDLYVFGEEVTINGIVKGDVCACGRIIRLNGTVEGDFMAAGQAIIITGTVTDDVRVAGQVLKIHENASIADDLIGAAFSLEFAKTSQVNADLIYAGYQALLNGDIEKDIVGSMANCEIAGHVGGDVKLSVEGDPTGPQAYTAGSPLPVSVPTVPAGLTIRDTARIDGDVSYRSATEASIASEAKIAGEIEQTQPPTQTDPTPAEVAVSLAGKFVTLLVIGICILLIAPGWTRNISDTVKTRPLASLGFGLVGTVGFVVLLLTLLTGMIALAVLAGYIKLNGLIPVVIVLGLSCGAMLIVSFWFFASYLAKIVISVFLGRWVLSLTKGSLAENRFVALVTGLLLLVLISNLPQLGTFVDWIVFLFACGALVLGVFWKSRTEPKTPAKLPPATA